MNLLEHYIKQIHKEIYKHSNKHNIDYVIVDVTYDCYGSVERKEVEFLKEEWEKAKEKGYFLG